MRQDGSASPPLPLGLAVVVAVAGIGMMLAASLWASFLLPILGFRGFLVLCEVVLLLPAAVALLVLRASTWTSTLAWSNPGRSTLLACAGLGATLWIASLGLLELQYAVWPPAPGYIEGFRRLHEMLRPKDALDALASLVAIAIVPALCEEALIRGLLLPSLRLHLAAFLSVGLSALLFSFMHDAYRMPFTFAVGLALGALRLCSADEPVGELEAHDFRPELAAAIDVADI
jgi:membrane protease YdiL (CAAX protease family)